MKWRRHLIPAAMALCMSLTGTALAQLSLGQNRGTPHLISVPPGPTALESGARLRQAVAGVDNASVGKPYVILLDPGEYDLGEETLTMKQWVSIRGSGRELTRISGGGDVIDIIRTASDTDIGSLTIEHRGGGQQAVALYSFDVVSVIIHDLTAIASNASFSASAIHNDQASPAIRNVQVAATDTGAAIVKGIANEDGASPTIWHAFIQATAPENGSADGISATTNCAPDIFDATILVTATGAGRGRGFYFLGNCTPTIDRVRATVSGGDSAIGIVNSTGSFLRLNDIHLVVSGQGASEASGIECISSATFDMRRGSIFVQGADEVIGVKGAQSFDEIAMSISESAVWSTGTSIENAVGLTVRVASTLIAGSVVNSVARPFHCVNCFDNNYHPLDDDCLPYP